MPYDELKPGQTLTRILSRLLFVCNKLKAVETRARARIIPEAAVYSLREQREKLQSDHPAFSYLRSGMCHDESDYRLSSKIRAHHD